jgi:hypothetical protein
MSTNTLTEVTINGYKIETYHSDVIAGREWKTMFGRNVDGTLEDGQPPYFVSETFKLAEPDEHFRWSKKGDVGILKAWHASLEHFDESASFFLLRKLEHTAS